MLKCVHRLWTYRGAYGGTIRVYTLYVLNPKLNLNPKPGGEMLVLNMKLNPKLNLIKKPGRGYSRRGTLAH